MPPDLPRPLGPSPVIHIYLSIYLMRFHSMSRVHRVQQPSPRQRRQRLCAVRDADARGVAAPWCSPGPMSAFSRLRGLPSALHSAEPASPALREFEAALSQRKDPSGAVTGDMSALSLLSTLRTASKSPGAAEPSSRNSFADIDPMAEEAERTSCISPWSSKSSERDATEVLFVNDGREIDVDEDAPFIPLDAAPASELLPAESAGESAREALVAAGLPPPVPTDTDGEGARAAGSTMVVEEGEELTVPFRVPSSRPSSARTAERLNGVHAQHAQQLQVLLSAFGSAAAADGSKAVGTTSGSALSSEGACAAGGSHAAPGAADRPREDGDSAGGLDGRLDGVLEALQRCRASLNSQQSSAVGEGSEAEFGGGGTSSLDDTPASGGTGGGTGGGMGGGSAGGSSAGGSGAGTDGAGGGDVLDTADVGGAATQAGGSGAWDAQAHEDRGEEEGDDHEEHAQKGTVGLLLDSFPAHIGELFGADSAELKEMALNRLQVTLWRR